MSDLIQRLAEALPERIIKMRGGVYNWATPRSKTITHIGQKVVIDWQLVGVLFSIVRTEWSDDKKARFCEVISGLLDSSTTDMRVWNPDFYELTPEMVTEVFLEILSK